MAGNVSQSVNQASIEIQDAATLKNMTATSIEPLKRQDAIVTTVSKFVGAPSSQPSMNLQVLDDDYDEFDFDEDEQEFYDDFYPEEEDEEGDLSEDHLYEEHDADLGTSYFDDPEAESGDEFEDDDEEFDLGDDGIILEHEDVAHNPEEEGIEVVQHDLVNDGLVESKEDLEVKTPAIPQEEAPISKEAVEEKPDEGEDQI